MATLTQGRLIFLLLATTYTAGSKTVETSPEVQRLLQENLRTASRTSEDTVAILRTVENLVKVAGDTSVQTEKVLTKVDAAIMTNMNVGRSVFQIRDELRVLDKIAATSEVHNVTFKNVEENVQEVASLVGDVWKSFMDCKNETAQRFKEFSSSVRHELVDGVKQHCEATASVIEKIDQTAQHISELSEDMRTVASSLAKVQNETSKKMQALEADLVRQQTQHNTWMKSIDAAVHQLTAVVQRTRQQKVIWHTEDVRRAIEESDKSPNPAFITSPKFVIAGYNARILLRINRDNGVAWLGVVFGLCPGSQDDFLQWPFLSPFELSFLHPTNSTRNVRRTFPSAYAEGKSLGLVKKPKKECAKGWLGFRNFEKISALRQNGFQLDDGLSVAVELYPRA